ncbi:hypothetical protein PVAP13_3KG082427 [Panicum virgatum]|uniref:Uncharacterized protein n=1 Tax=Panicum virgatum TaxID=38727 RepID=A0A8T0USB8_PANVG|nr:hypothetical protein PVAP13_3KG082427 [Panicum virgatum]
MQCQTGINKTQHQQRTQCERERLYRKCCAALVALILLVLFVVLIVWLVLRPHKPRFYLQDLSVLCLNVTPPASPTSSPPCRPRSRRATPTTASASTTTRPTRTPTTRASPSPCPRASPCSTRAHGTRPCGPPSSAPSTASSSRRSSPSRWPRTRPPATCSSTSASMAHGWVRWKVGTWISGHYHLRVNCPALLTVNEGKGSYGANTGGGTGYFRFQQAAACAVDV